MFNSKLLYKIAKCCRLEFCDIKITHLHKLAPKMRQITEQSGQTDKREIHSNQGYCRTKTKKCIVQCYVLEQVRLLVADLLNSSSTLANCSQLQPLPFAFEENDNHGKQGGVQCIEEAGICCQLSVLTLI